MTETMTQAETMAAPSPPPQPSGARIPRTLHHCWFGGRPMSPLGQRCVESWGEVMPGYALRRWDESLLPADSPYVALAHRRGKWAFVADYVRCHALHAEGGVYLDTDVEALRPFDGLLGHALFLGWQRPGSVGAGVIGAVPGHPFLRRVMDALDAEARAGRPSFLPLPELVTALAAEEPEATRPTLLPEEVFYPYNPYSPVPLRRKPLQSNMTERTLGIHHWEGAWLGDLSLRGLLALRVREAAHRARARLRRAGR